VHIATYIGACFLSLLCTEGNVQAHTRWWARTGRQHRTDLEICQRPVVCSSWIAVSTMREPGTMVSVSVTFCMLLMPVITKCFTLNLHFVGNNFMYWYTVSQKSSTPKSWQYFCQFLTDFYSSFTVERELNFQQTHVSLPTKPSVCCCTTLQKLEVQILANLICLLSFLISCGCTTLMNWSSRCCIFGMALTTHHWQCNWWVAWVSSCMCAGKRRTLRASVMTIFSHMTRDFSVFVKSDTIFRLFFVKYHKFEFLTIAR